MCTRTYAHIRTHTYTRACTHIHTCMHTHTHTHTHTHAHRHTHTDTQTYTHTLVLPWYIIIVIYIVTWRYIVIWYEDKTLSILYVVIRNTEALPELGCWSSINTFHLCLCCFYSIFGKVTFHFMTYIHIMITYACSYCDINFHDMWYKKFLYCGSSNTRIHIHMHTHTHAHTYTHTYTHIHTHVHTRVHTHYGTII